MSHSSSKLLFFIFLMFWPIIIIYNGCAESPFQASQSSSGSLNDETQNQDPQGEDSQSQIDEPSPPDMPNPPTTGNKDLKPAFLAATHQGGSLYSCDGGKTWKGYLSVPGLLRCTDPNLEGNCGHSPWSANALTWGPGGFIIVYGHGAPGKVIMSKDGDNWKTVNDGNNFPGVAFGNNSYILLRGRNLLISMDNGETWVTGSERVDAGVNLRQFEFAPTGGGTFIALAGSNDVVNTMISNDNGLSFHEPDSLPNTCGAGSLAFGNNTLVNFSQSLCISSDSGKTWKTTPKPNANFVVFDGENFMAYGAQDEVQVSPDGVAWQKKSLKLNGEIGGRLRFRKVTFHSETHRFVAINREKYEKMNFYYSDDGVSWNRVEKEKGDAPLAPHPVRHISAGYLENCQ